MIDDNRLVMIYIVRGYGPEITAVMVDYILRKNTFFMLFVLEITTQVGSQSNLIYDNKLMKILVVFVTVQLSHSSWLTDF